MKTLFIGLAGLNTEPESDMLGLRPFLLDQASRRADASTLFLSYADPDLVQKVEAAINSVDRVVMFGHSFGGAAAVYLADTLNNNGSIRQIDLMVLLDPAPNEDRFHQHFPWQLARYNPDIRWKLPERIVRKAICFHQFNMQFFGAIGVCGCPLYEVEGKYRNIDVTPWGLDHNGMVSDVRVQAVAAYAIDELVRFQ